MPHRDWKLRIKDIVDAINAIQGYTEGMKYKTFVADRKTVDAVIRNLTVIGEAAGHVPDDSIDNKENTYLISTMSHLFVLACVYLFPCPVHRVGNGAELPV